MLDKDVLRDLEDYIAIHRNAMTLSENTQYKSIEFLDEDIEIENFIKEKRKPSFQQLLLSHIDQSGATDPEIYKKAGLDRKHFSKIRKASYQPSKRTVLALVLALELSMEEAEELLHASGFALSDSDESDLVIQYCMENGIYDLDDVNMALEHFALKPLV